jgi:hypothetical protein
MASMAFEHPAGVKPTTLEWLLNGVIFCVFASAFVVYIEPAPTDILFLLALVLFAASRLFVTAGVTPLLLMLLLYNFGGFLSYILATPHPDAAMFVITSAYMAVSGVVLAYYVANSPRHHMHIIGMGWIIGGVIAAIWGLIDYFNLPSPFPLQVLPGRAAGLFKDPNVFSTFIVFPLVYSLQKIMTGQTRHPILLLPCFGITLIGLFLSFSRGAWINFVLAAMIMLILTYKEIGSGRLQIRIMLYGAILFLLAIVAFMVLMSIPTIRDMFLQRFSLVQSYDAGETGRFGNQLRSIPDLIVRPFGHGPFIFAVLYGLAPHNTFIHAFSAYGWLGGIVYFGLTLSTFYIGIKTVLAKSPWQIPAISVFACIVSVVLQGVQIDTDHWRHFYWLLGMMWGLFAATLHYGYLQKRPRATFATQYNRA